jgi:subtilisin-like proprotein convertase family protein
MIRSWLTKLFRTGAIGTPYFLTALLTLSLLSGSSEAQTFTNSIGGPIPATGNAVYFYIPVSSLPASQLDSNYGLITVCIDITHPRVSNLGVSIVSPDGNQIDLVDGAGANGANFTGTCFSMSDSVTIFSGFAPFTGGYYPRHNIGEVNDGETGLGAWILVIQNLVEGDSGVVNSWSMTFGPHAPVPVSTPFGPCNQYNASGCGCADSTQTGCWLVPDMFVGREWFTDTIHRKEFHDSIRVSNSVANIGYGPMEFYGTGLWFCGDSEVVGSVPCPDSTLSKETIRQRIYQKNASGYFTYKDTAAGTMDYHPELGHNHMHIDDWTENTLRIRGPESDPSKWPIIGRGLKTSMNVYDEIICDNVFTACDYGSTVYSIWGLRNAGLGLGYSSGNAYIQGISVGYADIYEYLIPFGQTIYFDSICNGDYVLMGQFDPDGRFVDMNPSNNITWFITTLTKQTPNCCTTKFDIDTVNYSGGLFQFIDRSVAIPAHWYWTFGDGDTSLEQFPYHQYTTGGSHMVTLTTLTAQGCGGSDTFIISVPQNVGIATIPADISISVYPNPSLRSFHLVCTGDMTHDVYLDLYNMLGQAVDFTSSVLSSTPTSRSLEVTISDPGSYALRIRIGSSTYYKMLVKQ